MAHDTTGFRHEGEGRQGLGRLLQKASGFHAHMALAVTSDELRDPLGIERYPRFVRGDERTTRCETRTPKFAFVIRSQRDRNLETGGKLLDALAGAPLVVQREVSLTARVGHSAPAARKIHPPREARDAKLSLSATLVSVKNPLNKELNLELNLVRVLETELPTDCAPVEWRLATTEPVDTTGQVLATVDAYRARWRIAEYFKALKTGCALEKRQLETLDALLNALGLFIPIAWDLLRLRVLSRHEQPASKVLNHTQLKVLRASSKLPAQLSARDAMFAIAKPGGHPQTQW